eukprot:3197611-Pleurochrysis_carterae.AAC.1
MRRDVRGVCAGSAHCMAVVMCCASARTLDMRTWPPRVTGPKGREQAGQRRQGPSTAAACC